MTSMMADGGFSLAYPSLPTLVPLELLSSGHHILPIWLYFLVKYLGLFYYNNGIIIHNWATKYVTRFLHLYFWLCLMFFFIVLATYY